MHASAGDGPISTAADNKNGCLLWGVTVLTTIDPKECQDIFGHDPKYMVEYLTEKLIRAGVDGIICSAQEVSVVNKVIWSLKMTEPRLRHRQIVTVTPGIRPTWAAVGDQKRTTTPSQAIRLGSDYLVIGSPIYNPPVKIGGMVEAFAAIQEEVALALYERDVEIEDMY